jgi:hypothetical protein
MASGKHLLKSARIIAGASTLALVTLASVAQAGSAATGAAHSPSWAGAKATIQAFHPAPAGVKPRTIGALPLRVPDPAAYAAAKAAANAASTRLAHASGTASDALSPTLPRNWAGLRDTADAPADSTGAIGTSRYIELINSQAGIYSRTSNTPLASGSLLNITGCFTSACTDSVFDPQIIWDPGTSRFYYATDDIVSSTENLFTFGFSTSSTPTLSASSWCRYGLNFGSTFPDYPKLGDTKDFLLVGTNFFNGSSFAGSGITWITKPGAGSTCPAVSTFHFGTVSPIKNANGTEAFTPVPSQQADPNSTGWVVARPVSLPATFLTLFKVTKGTSGAVISATGTSLTVSSYGVPAAAPQPGTNFKLDTLDGRNTQATLAVDPAHGGVTALWTQHTVFGGAGAQVRWYEINPATHSLIQHGTISSSTAFTFDGAVSSDRRVNGTSHMFGGDAVFTVVQSSSTLRPTIDVASKIGTATISGLRVVATSAASDTGFDCMNTSNVCRWGDYAAVTPDPASSTTASRGLVWGSSMLGAAGGSSSSAGWTTRNFSVSP